RCWSRWAGCAASSSSGARPRTTCRAHWPTAVAPRPGRNWRGCTWTAATRRARAGRWKMRSPAAAAIRCAPCPAVPAPHRRRWRDRARSATSTACRASPDPPRRPKAPWARPRTGFPKRPRARRSALDDGAHAHAAGGADRHQRAALALLLEQLGGRGDDAGAGGGEGMAERQRGAVDVELRRVDGAERRVEAEPLAAEGFRLPGAQRAQHLGGKGLVDLVEIEVLQRQLVARQQPR